MAYRGADGTVIDRPRGMSWDPWSAAPSIIPETPRDRDDQLPLYSRQVHLPRCPEIDCVRHLLSPGVVAFAELRAAEVGVGADRVLIAQGLLDEETYLAEFARWLGVTFEPMEDRPRSACPLTDEHLIEAVNVGLLPLIVDGDTKLIIAPRELTNRRLLDALDRNSNLTKCVRVTTAERMAKFAYRHTEQTIAFRASEALRTEHPELSAATGRQKSVVIAILVAAIAVFALVAPGVAALVVEVVLGIIFLSWTALRLLGTLSMQSVRRTPRHIADHQLPVYTLAIALYREAAAAKQLVLALRNIDYPGIR